MKKERIAKMVLYTALIAGFVVAKMLNIEPPLPHGVTT